MSEQQNNKRKYPRYAFMAWLAALAVFMLVLCTALFRAPSLSGDEGQKQAEEAQKRALRKRSGLPDPGFIIQNLAPAESVKNPDPPFDPKDDYVLVAFGLQGFFQSSPAGLPWRLDLPEKTIAAQLVRRGFIPQTITDGIKITWELAEQYNSADGPAFSAKSGEMTRTAPARHFSASIDAEPEAPAGGKKSFNPYPVLGIKAQNSATGEIVAETAAVLAVAPGFGCSHCHSDPGYALLALHDKKNGTGLEAQGRSGDPVLCKSCHMDLFINEQGQAEPGFVPGFSTAVHGWHAQFLTGKGEEACLSCHIGLAAPQNTGGKRPERLFMRGIHLTRGLACTSCHGPMEDHALALLQAESAAGQEAAARNMQRLTPRSVQKAEEIKPRLAWVQEPDCTGCHDFKAKPKIKSASGFNKWTGGLDGAELFSRRASRSGTIRCASCHGAPHAIYPTRNPVSPDRDNIAPLQYQEHARVLGGAGNCAMCHTRRPPVSGHHPMVGRSGTMIAVPQGAELMMPQVRFSHEAHTQLIECSSCHHSGYTDGGPLACTSSGCHDAADPEALKEGQDYRYFQEAFHSDERGCIACHERRQARGKAAGPVDCQDCHLAPSARWGK